MSTDAQITELLQSAASGDQHAVDLVVERVYAELERLAESKLRRRYGRELAGATLEPAALVNETLFKILRRDLEFSNRRHLFAFANRVMTSVLLDYERRKHAVKRGGADLKVSLSGLGEEEQAVQSARLAETLEQLAELDARKAEVAKLRIFWGFDHKEVAKTLEVSSKTVERDWRFAKAWLGSRLQE